MCVCVCVCVCVRACVHVCNCVFIRPANHLTGQNTSHASFLQLNISSCSSWTYPSLVPRLYMRTARKVGFVHFLISLSIIKRTLVRNTFWIITYQEGSVTVLISCVCVCVRAFEILGGGVRVGSKIAGSLRIRHAGF